YISSFIFCSNKCTFTTMGKTIADEIRNKTTVRKFFESKSFYSREILRNVMTAMVLETIKLCGTKGLYVLLVDGTCIQRGGDTLVENATKYRDKKQKKKGKRSTKAHGFLMCLLIMPDGKRVCYEYSYNTKKYCKKHKLKFKTQHELMCDIIKDMRLIVPFEAKFVVVADSFFDSKEVFKCCMQNKAIYIVPADTNRVHKIHKKSEKLHISGETKKKDSIRLSIEKGNEKYTCKHIRYASDGSGKKRKDEYLIYSESLMVSGMKLQVVYSWKKKKGKSEGESYKVLLCSDKSISQEEIIELYALRWQIEIFFRELKSELGLCDYSGKNFKAYNRFVDVCLLSYLFLEYDREQRLMDVKSNKEKSKIKVMRTRGLVELLRWDCMQDIIAMRNLNNSKLKIAA
ncbi:MAG: transposase, partial [Leptospiraceae bacterium]|nr:transposase [Leptospiraceae bacterium]